MVENEAVVAGLTAEAARVSLWQMLTVTVSVTASQKEDALKVCISKRRLPQIVTGAGEMA